VEPWLLVQGGRATTVKTRLVAQGQQLLRVDREETTPIHPKLAERMLRIARDAMAATSLTILSDYRKGVMAGDVASRLVAAAKQAGRPVLVDVRGGDFAPYAGADVVLPSRRDLARATGLPADDDASVAVAAAHLRKLHRFGAVLVGRAEDGMTLVHDGGVEHFRRQAVEAFDVSGAGDSGVATLGAALAAGVALPVACRLANIAAGIAMGRMGTAVVREQDLLGALSPGGGVLRKLVSRDVVAGHMERWRRRGWRTGFTHGCFDSLRPGHIHMLQQARAACDRLVVAITGDALAPARPDGRPAQAEIARAARLAALPGVDLVVITEDDSPTSLLQLLRPDVLITGADVPEPGDRAADVISQWGGRVVRADRLPEPA
jgi:D-beta-D-heptose 7-phosphate kinase / D-beta-D-heptose 1-phosphate adenosyltransferase